MVAGPLSGPPRVPVDASRFLYFAFLRLGERARPSHLVVLGRVIATRWAWPSYVPPVCSCPPSPSNVSLVRRVRAESIRRRASRYGRRVYNARYRPKVNHGSGLFHRDFPRLRCLFRAETRRTAPRMKLCGARADRFGISAYTVSWRGPPANRTPCDGRRSRREASGQRGRTSSGRGDRGRSRGVAGGQVFRPVLTGWARGNKKERVWKVMSRDLNLIVYLFRSFHFLAAGR